MFNKTFKLREPDAIVPVNGYDIYYWVEDTWGQLSKLKEQFTSAGYSPTTCLFEDKPAIKYFFKKE